MQQGPTSSEARLHAAVEPVAQLGYAAYAHRRSLPDLDPMGWYLGGRLGGLGRVPGAAAVALLAVLPPEGVMAGVARTWAAVDPEELIACRLDAVARLLAEHLPADLDLTEALALARRGVDALEPAGHALFASWRDRAPTGGTAADLWLLTVALREHRGAAHIAAWRAQGLGPAEILVLTEAWTDLPLGSHAGARMGWGPDAVAAAVASLEADGLVAGGAITPLGRTRRNAIELATDVQERPAVAALGDDLETLCAALQAIARATAAIAP